MNSGIILLDKQPGVTSFDALRDIKRALGTGKVGHTGTLDKFAGGLLLVLTGKALKLSRWFSHCDKKYTGIIHFGRETDTLDPEGNIIAEAAPPSRDDVEKILSGFTGIIMQEPPVYSAIHVNGKRASNLARSGNAPVMKKREVTIYKLELISWQPPLAEIFVHCSSGTYIRSLARDIALAANSRGYLKSLLRTEIAGFTLDKNHTEAQRLEGHREIEENITLSEKNIKVLPIDKSIISKIGLLSLDVSKEKELEIIHGKPIENIIKSVDINLSAFNKYCAPRIEDSTRLCENSSVNQSLAVFCNETLIAVLEKIDGKWKYGCVM